MIENVKVLCHSSIKFNKEKVIYIDPFRIKEDSHDADIIFITHSHYDHFSKEDIIKIRKENTSIVITQDLYDEVLTLGFSEEKIYKVEPNRSYVVEGIKIETIPAYNLEKQFHLKKNNWVGYIIIIHNIRYYIAGDTDITEENKKVNCDVAFVPVGGTYTMNAQEAASLINQIKPKIAIPIHYGEIVGNNQDAIDFVKLVNPEIDCRILMK